MTIDHATTQPYRVFTGIEYVFLDRDGVMNRKPPEGEYVAKWADFHPLPGSEAAVAALNASGRTVIIVSNQRGVALGLYSENDVRALHGALQQHLAAYSAHIDAFYFCPHDKNQCDCRKPRTGLFEQAFRDFPGASSTNSVMIGDSLSDIQAARNLSMPSIFVAGEPSRQKPGTEKASSLADCVAESLAEAVKLYLP